MNRSLGMNRPLGLPLPGFEPTHPDRATAPATDGSPIAHPTTLPPAPAWCSHLSWGRIRDRVIERVA